MIAFQSDLFRHAGREETVGTCYLRASHAAEENWSIVSFYSASTAHICTWCLPVSNSGYLCSSSLKVRKINAFLIHFYYNSCKSSV